LADDGVQRRPVDQLHGVEVDPALLTGGVDRDDVGVVQPGDGSAHTTFDASSPGSLGTRSHAYADDGTYTVIVAVRDKDHATSSTSFTIGVANAAPTATLIAGNVTYGTAVTAGLSSPFDPSPADAAAGFHYAFGYATTDSSPLAGATYAGGGMNASADFGALGAGTYYVFARVIDDGGFTEYSRQVTVSKAYAVISVTPYSVTNDGTSHTATARPRASWARA
jgi:hypothetical protein